MPARVSANVKDSCIVFGLQREKNNTSVYKIVLLLYILQLGQTETNSDKARQTEPKALKLPKVRGSEVL